MKIIVDFSLILIKIKYVYGISNKFLIIIAFFIYELTTITFLTFLVVDNLNIHGLRTKSQINDDCFIW